MGAINGYTVSLRGGGYIKISRKSPQGSITNYYNTLRGYKWHNGVLWVEEMAGAMRA